VTDHVCPRCRAALIPLDDDTAICASGHWLRAAADGQLEPLDDSDEPVPPERRSQATRLIGYALASGARFLLDQFGQPHALADGVPLALPRGAYPWLRRLFWQHEQRGVTGEALAEAGGTLEAFALHEGARVTLYVRSAWDAASRRLFVWLGPRRILAIGAEGWRVLEDAPVLFRVYPTTGELPDPVAAPIDALDDLLDLVAPADEAGRRLTLAWIGGAWLEHVARPILLHTGDAGAGKSTRQRVIKRLLDPTKPESIRLDQREIVQKLMHCQVALLDNLGSLPEWAIDTLCRAVTGEGDSKRRLYSDDDDVVYEFRRALLLNGINPPADRPDFADRLLPVELERIPDDRRVEEEVLWARFAERHPAWLGALATLLSRAVALEPAVQLRRKPRLASWGRWAAAVYAAMGWGAEQFERDWALVIERQQAAAIDGSPVAQAVLRFMAERHHWRGTASELLAALEPVALELNLARARGWPKSPVWLSRRLRELRPVLLDRGLLAREEREGRERTRFWILEHHDDPSPEEDPERASIASIPSAPAENPHPEADLAADGNADSKRSVRSIPSALPSARNPHDDAHADGTGATDSISGALWGESQDDDAWEDDEWVAI